MIKIKKYYFALLFLFTALFQLSAQTTVTIPAGNPAGTGANNTSHRKPLGSYYGYERSAIKYTAHEINAIGTITSISFYCDTTNSSIGANTPVKIYLKEISDSTFAAGTTVNTEETNSTLVYSGTLTAAQFIKNSFITITLTTPFSYTGGTNNLEVIIETNVGGTGNDGQLSKGFRYYKTLPDYRFQYWQQDNAPSTGTGALDSLRPNVQFNLTPFTPCSGAPIAGNTIASDSSVCIGTSISLTLQGNAVDSGLTYQWQSSPDNISWADISGATSTFLIQSINDTIYFHCVVSCGSNLSASAPVMITLTLPTYCYCTTGLGGACNVTYPYDSADSLVSILGTTLNNPHSGCSTNYTVYPVSGNTTATLTAGQPYTFSMILRADMKVSAWIDYDHNGVFGIYEWIPVCTSSTAGATTNATFTVSPNAINGLTGMRIRSRIYTGQNDSSNACSTFGSGETEDYYVTIIGGLAFGIKTNEEISSSVNVYPNPSTGQISLSINNSTTGKASYQILDLSGKVIVNEFINQSGNYTKNIDLSYLDKGIYLLRYINSKETITKKVVLQ